jgi:hypothetical protein
VHATQAASFSVKKLTELEEADALRWWETLAETEHSVVVAGERTRTRGRGQKHEGKVRAAGIEDPIVSVWKRKVDGADQPIPKSLSLWGQLSLPAGLAHRAQCIT